MTSSNTSSAPCSVASRRSASRNPAWAAIRPPLTATGSHRIAATWPRMLGEDRLDRADVVPLGDDDVRQRGASGIPAVAGTVAGRSAGPDRIGSKPVLANTPSSQPW